ncbi:unnamed protein product [Haemonchus placei]|uniref:Uncharacterized protein n=1 Tax=Haemonchus placei TaxID=6290 RepID=A0A3P7SVS3_HAEPC|nr:unnamed protein product [Haemonchus placei]
MILSKIITLTPRFPSQYIQSLKDIDVICFVMSFMRLMRSGVSNRIK